MYKTAKIGSFNFPNYGKLRFFPSFAAPQRSTVGNRKKGMLSRILKFSKYLMFIWAPDCYFNRHETFSIYCLFIWGVCVVLVDLHQLSTHVRCILKLWEKWMSVCLNVECCVFNVQDLYIIKLLFSFSLQIVLCLKVLWHCIWFVKNVHTFL